MNSKNKIFLSILLSITTVFVVSTMLLLILVSLFNGHDYNSENTLITLVLILALFSSYILTLLVLSIKDDKNVKADFKTTNINTNIKFNEIKSDKQ